MLLSCSSAVAVLVLKTLGAAPEPIAPPSLLRVDIRPVAGGGELITYYARLSSPASRGELPLASVLRDSLGDTDPANDRLRFVYLYGYTQPPVRRRLAAAIPFLYARGVSGGDRHRPQPVVDLARPARGTAAKLAGALLQSAVLDPMGGFFRASSRAYLGRDREFQAMRAFRAFDVLRRVADDADSPLPPKQFAEVEGRLWLSTRLLGGLVSRRAASELWPRQREASEMARAHNWELLRQRAEESGLIFEPLRIGSEDLNFAVLWVDQDAPVLPFDGKLLGIANPFSDPRVRKWPGYRKVDSRGKTLVPLALYALDHPRAPLLMVDFRSPGRIKRREVAWRFTDDLATGVLGWTGWGNWPYLAGKAGVRFVAGRHGAPVNRMARVRAYVQLRQALLLDRSLPPEFRRELMHGLDHLGWNPLEEGLDRDAGLARSQYQEVIGNESRLADELERGRRRELRSALTRAERRHLSQAGRIAALDRIRRGEFEQRARLERSRLPQPDFNVAGGH